MSEELFTLRKFPKDSILCMEGSKASGVFYIVQSGELIEETYFSNFAEKTVFKPGDTFGLISCFTEQPYISRVTAKTESEVIVVKRKDVIAFLSTKTDIFLKIISIYSNKLRFLNRKLIGLSSNSIYQELPERLLEVAEFFKGKEQSDKYLYALKKYVETAGESSERDKAAAEVERLEKMARIKVQEPKVLQNRTIYQEEDIIFLEQEQGENFFYIEKGRVKISHFTSEGEFILAILNEGEFFGEMALLNHVARSASAIAYQETRILSLQKDNLFENLKEPILINIFQSLARRLWHSYRRVLNLSYERPVTRLYDFLDVVLSMKEGVIPSGPYDFDITLADLQLFTGTQNCKPEELKEFLNDKNIHLNYGLIKIDDIDLFKRIVTGLVNHEKQKR